MCAKPQRLLAWMCLVSCITVVKPRFTAFSWKSCATSPSPIKINSLNVYLNDTDNLYVTGRGKVAYDVDSPIQGDVKMSKKMLGVWVPIPCIDNYGTCSYSDVCAMSPYTDDCPKIFVDNNLPCKCPIPEGRYSFKNLPIPVNFLPKWLEKGSYNIRISLLNSGRELLCLKMAVDI